MTLPGRNSQRIAARRRRSGLSLAELMVTMVIVGIIGGAFTKVMIHQGRFFDAQRASRNARSVSRGALNVMLSDLRMIATPGGLTAATNDAITARVPYAFGIFCATGGASSTISLAPVDSMMLAEPGAAGYAWRDDTGNYTYVEAGFATFAGLAAPCTGANVTTLPGGRLVRVTPALPATTPAGTPVFLYRRIRYQFRASAALPTRRALWRDNLRAGTREEVIAPFTSTAMFRFFVDGTTAAQTAPPPLANIRGIELLMFGESERSALGTTSPKTAGLTTAVFFMNRAP